MSSTASAPAAHGVRPRQTAPALTASLLGGGTFSLDERQPDASTMIVFFRGLHCPVCRAQLSELNRRLEDLAERGIELIAVSGETRERSEQLGVGVEARPHPDRVRADRGLQMRDWGLFVSRGLWDSEPPLFNEPGLFLISPDGSVYLRIDPVDARGPAATRRSARGNRLVDGQRLPRARRGVSMFRC